MILADGPDRPSQVVYGMVLDDERTATLVRRVMNISVVIAVLVLIRAFMSPTPFYVILIPILIPFCGYFGAKNRDLNLLTCFWVSNLILAIVCVIYGVYGVWIIAETTHYNKTLVTVVAALACFAAAGCYCMVCMWGRELAMTPTFVTATVSYPVVATYGEVVTTEDAEYAELK